MRFNDAVVKLVEGKKIRRANWGKGNYWNYKDGNLLENNEKSVEDWEIEGEDNWSLLGHERYAELITDGKVQGIKAYSQETIIQLKQKILEEITNLTAETAVAVWMKNRVTQIISKRFGI